MNIFTISIHSLVYNSECNMLLGTENELPWKFSNGTRIDQYEIIGKKRTIFYSKDLKGRAINYPRFTIGSPVERFKPCVDIRDKCSDLFLLRIDDIRPIRELISLRTKGFPTD